MEKIKIIPFSLRVIRTVTKVDTPDGVRYFSFEDKKLYDPASEMIYFIKDQAEFVKKYYPKEEFPVDYTYMRYFRQTLKGKADIKIMRILYDEYGPTYEDWLANYLILKRWMLEQAAKRFCEKWYDDYYAKGITDWPTA